jgi:hypothetical protein
MTELEVLKKRQEYWIRYCQDLVFLYKEHLFRADKILHEEGPIVLSLFREPVLIENVQDLHGVAQEIKQSALQKYALAYV